MPEPTQSNSSVKLSRFPIWRPCEIKALFGLGSRGRDPPLEHPKNLSGVGTAKERHPADSGDKFELF